MSTGTVGWFAEKSKSTSAVLGPTPGSCMRVSLAFSKGIDKIGVRLPPNFSRTILDIPFITRALFLYNPATLKHSSISVVSAFASVLGVMENFFERFPKAFAVFLSEVFWEIIVIIKVSKGSCLEDIHFGNVKFFLRVSRIFSALFSIICRSPFESDK